MAWVDPDVARTISRLPGVYAQIKAHAEPIAIKARALLAEHHQTGNAHIEVEHDMPDVLVSLVDPDGNAVAIEYGRGGVHKDNGIFIDPAQGLYILTRAAKL